MKVLIIDDSEKVRQEVLRALTDEGYEVIEAIDGRDGLQKLRAHPDLALALCDINMPVMTGLDLLSQISKDGSKTPIVMLTSEGQPSLVSRAKQLGARGWMLKPVRTESLIGVVRRLTSPSP